MKINFLNQRYPYLFLLAVSIALIWYPKSSAAAIDCAKAATSSDCARCCAIAVGSLDGGSRFAQVCEAMMLVSTQEKKHRTVSNFSFELGIDEKSLIEICPSSTLSNLTMVKERPSECLKRCSKGKKKINYGDK